MNVLGKGKQLLFLLFITMGKHLTKDDFIKKSRIKHGDKYDYSLVEYKKNSIKVKIICPEHGEFEQTPADHMAGKGCRACGIIKNTKSRTMSQEEFIRIANEVHKGKYDYSRVNYVNIDTYSSHLEGFNMMAENVNYLSEEFSVLNGNFNDTQNILQGKQDKLESGANIKTINGLSLLGSGDIVINGGESTEHVNLTLKEYNNLSDAEKMNGKVYFITDISYCLYSDYDRLNDTVISLTNRVKVLENSIKSPENNL